MSAVESPTVVLPAPAAINGDDTADVLWRRLCDWAQVIA